jgi:hypothetical protein
VRDEVMKATDNKQEPFTYGSLGGATVALVQTAALANSATSDAPAATAAPATIDPAAVLRRNYEYAERVGTKEAWESFLKNYPTGFYGDLARAQLSKLGAEQASTTAAEKARKATEEKARLMREGASQSDQAKADAEIKSAQKAKLDAEAAKKREQAKIAAAERKKKREEARIASANRNAGLQRAGAGVGAGAGPDSGLSPRAQQAKSAPKMDRAALWAKCDAMFHRSGGRDDDITRPGRVQFCVDNGGRP